MEGGDFVNVILVSGDLGVGRTFSEKDNVVSMARIATLNFQNTNLKFPGGVAKNRYYTGIVEKRIDLEEKFNKPAKKQ
ncbi:hypothetical protein L2E82_00256 [Cichorium intybus]|uniref:Uncharacterized protein n=1 Tax=Cichorium intybus TaxID=13427 RepID=A0ACB9GXQ1_CICIN|nr:hypothetical protein L2E82_00256 [Cichorium intybus]